MSKRGIKIYGVVVLYNPTEEILVNINSYIDHVDKLYSIDNSEQQNIGLVNKLNEIDKIEYIWNKENLGIGYALNLAAREAIKEGASWLLTMDQDSKFIGNGLQKLIQFINNTDTSDIGIVSPYHWLQGEKLPSSDNIREVLRVMTSGNLLNLEIFKKIGPFREDFFIDSIDNDYCLRLRLNNFKIVVLDTSVLKHRLGNISTYKLLFKSLKTTNYVPLRRYYITRNRLYIVKEYMRFFPLYCINLFKNIFIDWLKIILFETDKLEKQKMIIRGFMDFIKGKTGKY